MSCCADDAVPQNLAEMVETFSAGSEQGECANGLREMIMMGNWGAGHGHAVNHKSQVITKFMLLERLSDVMDCQPWVILAFDRVNSTTKVHSKMEGVLKAVIRWPAIFNSLKEHVDMLDNRERTELIADNSRQLTAAQDAHLRGLNILNGARKSGRLAKYATIDKNVQYMAFMLHWHCTVSPPLPCDRVAFNPHISRSITLLSPTIVLHSSNSYRKKAIARGSTIKLPKLWGEWIRKTKKSCLDV